MPALSNAFFTRRRSSRIAYLGLIYNFGKPAKKPKKEDLQFDNTL